MSGIDGLASAFFSMRRLVVVICVVSFVPTLALSFSFLYILVSMFARPTFQ